MFQRKPSRFRRKPNGRGHRVHSGGSDHNRLRSNSFSNNHTRNNFRNNQSAEKLLEKYSTLAKEASSSGDKTLSENYLQHADHYARVVSEKNNRTSNQVNNKIIDVKSVDNKIETEKPKI
jgi:hypothetical protein